MGWTLGIDLACRAAHVASLAAPDGTIIWTGRTFFTRPAELERLLDDIDCDPTQLTVVMEPTRNAWSPVAAWFERHGCRIVLVPTSQSSDLRQYYSKHTKNDRLDSRLLARLPLLHPEGLADHRSAGPAEPLRRAVRHRSSLVKRRSAVFARLDALLELLGPAWYEALGADFGNASLHLLAHYANPTILLRLGLRRLAEFLRRYSHGQWNHDKAVQLIDAAKASLDLWDGDGIDFTQLGLDIAIEAEQALLLGSQIRDLDARIAELYQAQDPDRVIASAPGVGPFIAAVIAGRVGDVTRFPSLAAVRSYSGLVPKVSQSGTSEHHAGVTKAGDTLLRESIWQAADMARRIDPQLAAKYVRLMNAGRHHDSAICHVATTLLTRIASCWRAGQPYQIRDLDGTILTVEQGKAIIVAQHQVEPGQRQARRQTRTSQRLKKRTGRVSQESPSAPPPRPVAVQPRSLPAA